jgi:hydroxymethylpyrimidine/phosphomethylpyrimidine kinase
MPLADAFCPLLLGGLYPGISRGLAADVLATQSLGGRPLPVCTTHVAAGHGTVTDVLGVPSDTVSAHLEHVFDTRAPSAALVGILADAPTATVVFDAIEAHLDGPCIYNCTLSGPSGEDLTGQRALEAVVDRLSVPDLVSLRVHDASLLAGMEIPSLDDAQVAVQRIVQQGAQRVLLRCGRLPTHHFDLDSDPPNYSADLYYDGDDFALFEAPFLDGLDALHGASSGLLVPVLQALQQGDAPEPALQSAKARVTEALKMAQEEPTPVQESVFFDGLRETPTTAMDESEA